MSRTTEQFVRLAREDRTGIRAYEMLYYAVLQFAQHTTGFVIDEEGAVNRPGDMAETLGIVAGTRPDSGVYAATIGLVAAVLFPRSDDLMGTGERREMGMFAGRYAPKERESYLIFLNVFKQLRAELMGLLRGLRPVLYADGTPVFTLSRDPFVSRVQCDLALRYQMTFRVMESQQELVALFQFVYKLLNAADEGEESPCFSRMALEDFVNTHFLGCAQGDGTRLVPQMVVRGLAYRLYLNRAFDAHFATGQLVESEFCQRVALCSPRTPEVPPMRLQGMPLVIRSRRSGVQNLENTLVDQYIVDAYDPRNDQ